MSRHKLCLPLAAALTLGLQFSPLLAQTATPGTVPVPDATNSGMSGTSGSPVPQSGMTGQPSVSSPPASLSIPTAPVNQSTPTSAIPALPLMPDSMAAPQNGMSGGMSGSVPQTGIAPAPSADGSTPPAFGNVSPAAPSNNATGQTPAGQATPGAADSMAAPGATPQGIVPDTGPDAGAPGDAGAGVDGADDPGSDNLSDPTDDLSILEMPDFTMVPLTPDIAKHAIDAYFLFGDKYKDTQIDKYETLQDFIDQDAQGKAFDADVKAAGFATVDEWDQAFTTVNMVYAYLTSPESADIKKLIADLKNNPDFAPKLTPEQREKVIAKYSMIVPSDDNLKVVSDLMADPAYAEKFKQLDVEIE